MLKYGFDHLQFSLPPRSPEGETCYFLVVLRISMYKEQTLAVTAQILESHVGNPVIRSKEQIPVPTIHQGSSYHRSPTPPHTNCARRGHHPSSTGDTGSQTGPDLRQQRLDVSPGWHLARLGSLTMGCSLPSLFPLGRATRA